jgi:hypothetical protein
MNLGGLAPHPGNSIRSREGHPVVQPLVATQTRRRCWPGSTPAGGTRNHPCRWVRPPPSRSGTSVTSRSRTRPGSMRPAVRAADTLSQLGGLQPATSRAEARPSAERQCPLVNVGEQPPAVGAEATEPNTSVWSRSTARSARGSPPSASITARSVAIHPGSCPIPRGRSGWRAVEYAAASQVHRQDPPVTVPRHDRPPPNPQHRH